MPKDKPKKEAPIDGVVTGEPVVLPTVSAEELLKEKGLTREEWNNLIAEKVKEIEADGSLTPEQKDQRISSLLLMTITKNNRFLFEELLG